MTRRAPRRSLIALRALLRDRGAAISLGFLALMVAMAAGAAWLPIEPMRQNVLAALQPPSAAHWFGTDELGRDIMARVIYGARTSLTTAAGAVLVAATIGIPMGLIAGYFGGWRDTVMMRLVDVLLALPGILFAMAIIAVLGRSQMAALVAVGITGIPNFARITRAQVLSLRSRDFVTAVEAFGAGSGYTMFRTVLPNAWSPILVQAIVLASLAILLEAALAFLGIGVPPPTPSWGEMLRTGKNYLHEAPHYAILPGVALTLTILAFDTLGRALSRVLEDRQDSGAGLAGPEGGR
jgi:ABC-type dipeptide/oligopeptide/nickel transport system permease subunit